MVRVPGGVAARGNHAIGLIRNDTISHELMAIIKSFYIISYRSHLAGNPTMNTLRPVLAMFLSVLVVPAA